MIDARFGSAKHTTASRDYVAEQLRAAFPAGVPDAIELGCGGNPQPGYLHTDFYADANTTGAIDVLCNARDLPFADASFRSALMFGVFEHFGYFEIQEVLLEISRILRPGGVFRFDVPDFDWFIHAYLTRQDKFTGMDLDPVRDEKWIIHSIFGGQDGPGMFHKWGWNEARLRAFLEKSNWNFSSVQLVGRQWRDPESNHLIWDCVKR